MIYISSDIENHSSDNTKHITSIERNNWNKNIDNLNLLGNEFADLLEQNTLTQYFVDSIDHMVDTTKRYVLKSTGMIYEYVEETVEQIITVTDHIEATDDNKYYTSSRFSQDGSETTGTSYVDYFITPYIDLTKDEYINKTIEIHLEGAKFATQDAYEYYIMTACYDKDKNTIIGRTYTTNSTENASTLPQQVYDLSLTVNSDTSATLSFKIPLYTIGSISYEIGYLRFCGKGDYANSNIYITYETTQNIGVSGSWKDTGKEFGYIFGDNDEIISKISELNNEGLEPEIIKLLPKDVIDFINTEDYPDDDYTITYLERYTYPYRADIPIPYMVKWKHNENAMRTILAVDTKLIAYRNNYTIRYYDVSGYNNYPLYNLLPNTTYYYKVSHMLADGSYIEAKSGSFKTSSEPLRLLYIDDIQNVRDLGGWTGLDGKTVKYGKIIRGTTFSDTSQNSLILTGKGKKSLAALKIKAELNLGSEDTRTEIAQNCAYKKIPFSNYAIVINNEIQRNRFKIILEYIVSCLNGTLSETGLSIVERNLYIHCQGGCDRTGSLCFLLLGLLGVSESDIAKEYEISSFSDIGFGRLRNNKLDPNVYDYVGMVEAIKTYNGNTITDKFYDFAINGCGISEDIIASFRNLMLE